MPTIRHTPEQIIAKLREAEVHLSQGLTIPQASKKLGVSEQTYYKWRKEYGGVRTGQAKRLKDLEKENARLKKLLAEAELDKAILKEDASVLLRSLSLQFLVIMNSLHCSQPKARTGCQPNDAGR
ncbi:Transposase [Blastopirellula retiformator]|uniref:Transposase n=1 Tax=Blastopirellula retiformator TaxID=2527970 RepID=A0A5C5VJZ7_9BACT|nr:Transposase [Blastopirellula retiformator]